MNLNSNSNRNIYSESTKFNNRYDKKGGFLNLLNQRKLSTPMYYSDYFTVIKYLNNIYLFLIMIQLK